MRDCLIVSHVSDSCGRKAATGDKRLPALSSSHQVGPVGYHAIVLTLLPVQPLLYLARALPTHPLHGILFGFPCCFRILIVSLLPLASKVMANIHHDSFLLRLIQLVFGYVLYSHRSLELIHRARHPARCFLAINFVISGLARVVVGLELKMEPGQRGDRTQDLRIISTTL